MFDLFTYYIQCVQVIEHSRWEVEGGRGERGMERRLNAVFDVYIQCPGNGTHSPVS